MFRKTILTGVALFMAGLTLACGPSENDGGTPGDEANVIPMPPVVLTPIETAEETFERAKWIRGGVYAQPRQEFLTMIKQFNPEARELIYAFVRNPEPTTEQKSTVGFLGFIGTAEDVPKILELIHGFPDELTYKDGGFIKHAISAITIMSYRGIDEATAELDRMIDPRYWDRFDPTVEEPSTIISYHNTQTDFAISALTSKSRTMDPAFPEKGKKVLDSLTVPEEIVAYQRYYTYSMRDFEMQSKAKGDFEAYVRKLDAEKARRRFWNPFSW